MRLNMAVYVDVVHTMQLKKLVYGFPIVVAFYRHLEETHILRSELTHLIFLINF